MCACYGTLEIGHAVVESQEVVIGVGVAVAPGLVAEKHHPPCVARIRRDDHATFARGHVLTLLEAERSDRSDRPHETLVLGGEIRLRAVLDHRDAVGLGHALDANNVARVAEEMCRNDCAGASREACGHRLGRDVQTRGIDVGEDGDRLLVENRRDGSHIGDRCRDDLIAWFGIDGGDGGVDRRRARRDGARVGDTVAVGEGLLEGFHLGALRAVERAGLDDLAQECKLLGAEIATGPVGV